MRLFGLLWAMFEGRAPLLLEEPELSIHAGIVRLLPQMLIQIGDEIRRMRKGELPRQVIINTHSEELLSDDSIAPEEVIRIEPGREGSTFARASSDDKALVAEGMTIAEVMLPRSAPRHGQLSFRFREE